MIDKIEILFNIYSMEYKEEMMSFTEKVENLLGREKSKAYYLREFKKIENGEFSWNWAACLCGGAWLIYRKSQTGIWKALGVAIGMLILAFFLTPEKSPIVVTLFIFLLLQVTVGAIIGGLFGNRWLYSDLRSKVKDGFHLYDEYRAVDVSALFIWIIAPITAGVVLSVFGINSNCATLIVMIIIALQWGQEKKTVKAFVAKLKDGYSTEINEENISKLI